MYYEICAIGLAICGFWGLSPARIDLKGIITGAKQKI
jgi:hypothetical protein